MNSFRWPLLVFRLSVIAASTIPLHPAAADSLKCAGSTFAAPVYQKWIQSFQAQVPGLPITFQPVGSESGLAALARKEVDFAASDYVPEKTQQAEEVHLIPTAIGAPVPAYNVPNLQKELRFTPALLADIYLGKVKTWDDPEIKAVNRNIRLPAEKIIVVHRSDGSGTSYIWSEFLSRNSPEWRSKAGAGSQPDWPTGEGAQGNEGMAALIGKTAYSLGYVEYIYALRHRLSYGSVKNAAGIFMTANIDSITAAASSARGKDDHLSILDAPGRPAYPIASFTWFVLPETIEPQAKRQRLQSFLEWMMKEGQKEVAALGYVAIPPDVAEHEREVIAHLWK